MKLFQFKYWVTIIVFSLLITFSFFATKTMFVNYEAGDISDRDIVSPKTVTFEDEEATEKQKELVLSQVKEDYELDPTVSTKQVEDIRLFFNSLIERQNEIENAKIEKSAEKIDEMAKSEEKKSQSSDILKEAEKELEVATLTDSMSFEPKTEIYNPYNFTKEEIDLFLKEDGTELRRMREVFAKQIENVYQTGITEDKMEEIKEQIQDMTIFSIFGTKVRETFLNKLLPTLEPNMKLNEEETEKRKQEALESVEPKLETVQSGVKIVGKNEIITEDHIRIMKEVGILNEKFNFAEAFKKLPFVLFLLTVFHVYLYRFSQKDIENMRLYVFVFTVTFLAIFLSNFFQNPYFSYSMFVVALIAITTFLNPSVSIVYSIMLSIFMYPGDYTFLTLGIVLGIVQAIGHNPQGDRSAFLNLGVIMSIASVVTYYVLSMLLSQQTTIHEALPLLVSPIVASIFVLGGFKYVESLLGLITSIKLHELDNTKHKLVQRLINEADGTFHHSLRVGQLAEAAGNKIGANSLLLKVGALYHDVGKLENPKYFIENTTPEENIHNHLEPKESAAYILRHPIDSVKLCRKYHIPEQIIQLIASHHGDGLVKYFYYKQKKIDGENVNESDFRYQTPLPKTKEEGILLLADSTEAFSRTLSNSNAKELEEQIRKLVYDKIQEGLLRNCELTMEEIELIIEAFVDHLLPANHKRIKYPGN